MSAKPYHVGHDMLIRLASKECDNVKVFVSLSDRQRPGEIQVLGSDMQRIWTDHIEPTLPGNVSLNYEGNPVRNIYDFLGKENEEGSTDTYVIYSDPADMEHSFPTKSLSKYLGDLYATGHVVLEPIHRSETVNVSGTMMRKWIQDNDFVSFKAHCPKTMDSEGIYAMLRQNAKLIPPKKKRPRKK